MDGKSYYRLQASAIFCAVLACALYANTLDCGICFDDEPAIKKNKDLRPDSPWFDLLYHDFWGAPIESPTSHKSYRPLTVATFRLNYLLHQLHPMGYHLVNVLLHSAVSYLYVLLCASVFDRVGPALIAGLLFAVHPVHTEAVAGLVGRTELLAGLFFIASFLCYRKAAIQEEKGLKWMLLCLIFALFSALSKEQGITVVAVCFFYDVIVVHKVLKHLRHYSSERLYREFKLSLEPDLPPWGVLLFWRSVALGVFTIAFLVMRVTIMHGRPLIFHSNINPPMALLTPYRQLSWLYLCFVNLWLLMYPTKLCADWRYGAVPLIKSIIDPHNLLTIATLSLILILWAYGVRGYRRRQTASFVGVTMMVFPFIPASNLFFPVGFVVAERVLYIPSMGFCMLVGYGVWCIIRRTINRFPLKAIVWTAIVTTVILLSIRTFLRNRDWVSNFTIYTAGVRCNPNNGAMLTNLGMEHAHLKNFSYAEFLYRHSIHVAPEHSKGYANLGGLLEALKKYDEAEEALRDAIHYAKLDETAGKVLDTYAFMIESVISRNQSRLEVALEACDEALASYPKYAQPYSTKGIVLMKMNQSSEALPLLKTAVDSGFKTAETYHYLGLAYLQAGNLAEAKRALQHAIALDSKHFQAMVALGRTLFKSGNEAKMEEAEKLYRHVLASKPHNTDALFHLADLYYYSKRLNDARVLYERLLQYQPSNKEALYRLGQIFYQSKSYSQAVKYFKYLLKIDPHYSDAAKLLKVIEKI